MDGTLALSGFMMTWRSVGPTRSRQKSRVEGSEGLGTSHMIGHDPRPISISTTKPWNPSNFCTRGGPDKGSLLAADVRHLSFPAVRLIL